MRSAVPAVLEALELGLAARPGLAGVQVTYGPPFPSPASEFVSILGVTEHERRVAGLRTAPHPHEEEFSVAVVVNVKRSTTIGKLVTDRAFEILGELDDWLREDLTVGGSITNGWARIAEHPLTIKGNEKEREAEMVVLVVCRARI